MRRRVPLLSLATLVVVASSLAAQHPEGWKVRYDHPGPDTAKLEFVGMPPGWHVTTGPSVTLWNPATTAKGSYKAESKIFLFKPSGKHAEGFGVFIGGASLESDAQKYTYFLIRNDGKYLIKERNGKDTKDVVPWTASSAIKTHDGKVESIDNVLTVTAGEKSVDFAINGTQVASRPRESLVADGVVGLRVNHNLNLHVATLSAK